MENNNQQQQQQQPQPPSLVGGHVQYVKGAAESAIGNISGSHAWTSSGEQDKAAGRVSMQRAGEQRDPSQGYDKAEELAGKLTGCGACRTREQPARGIEGLIM